MRVFRAIIFLGCLYRHVHSDISSANNTLGLGTESVTEYSKADTFTATAVGSQVTENTMKTTSQDTIRSPSLSPKTVTSSGGTQPSSSTAFISPAQILTTPASPTTGDELVYSTSQTGPTFPTDSTVLPTSGQMTKAMEHTAFVPSSSSNTVATTGMSSNPRLMLKTIAHSTQKPSEFTSGSVNQQVMTMGASTARTTTVTPGSSVASGTAVQSFQKPFHMVFSTEAGRDNDGEEWDVLYQICQKLTKDLEGAKCTLNGHYGENKIIFEDAVIQVSPTLLDEYYKDLKDQSPQSTYDYTTLIAVLASCGAVLLLALSLAIYAACSRKANRKGQQHLTEELQTVENGYHDNPTLEVTEAQPEMQEKSALSGELNSSWIVPGDGQTKEGMPDEEDTHL
ncbi:hypothetical protein GJAV_G00158570 [Gymnothorax javanicus]|nr:hypothetical protein GJAV_G00158570 [Gymnothorax javanicus]